MQLFTRSGDNFYYFCNCRNCEFLQLGKHLTADSCSISAGTLARPPPGTQQQRAEEIKLRKMRTLDISCDHTFTRHHHTLGPFLVILLFLIWNFWQKWAIYCWETCLLFKFVFLLQKCHCKIWLGRLGIGYAKNTCLSFMRQFVIKSMIVKWNPVSLKKDGRGRMRDWGELLLCWGFDFVQFSLFLISYLFFVFLLKFTKFWGSQILAFYKKLWEMPQLIS